ncbi:hypothetical protein L0664_14685 [Octadecabacter sp. G9-8]|uniref:Uncharacterized protein n=1 Tax=Octadecabacter dasysiphoniae TaxID=2909341 RepID=A0ABS9CYJ2_9RHOB|nr:hypothetical protein [Octadecabacter dasysiphoniae]MCF2872318.1 hypothetical protein [Octadecabacter dasysiphoniae]
MYAIAAWDLKTAIIPLTFVTIRKRWQNHCVAAIKGSHKLREHAVIIREIQQSRTHEA